VENISTEQSSSKKPVQVTITGQEEAFDVRTDPEVISKLESQLRAVEEENKRLEEEKRRELLKELKSMFYDEPSIQYEKNLQKVQQQEGRSFIKMMQRFNGIVRDFIEEGEPVPIGLYVMTPEKKLIPIKLNVYFEKKDIVMSLWENKMKPT
jgi:DNA-binding protein YbaB